MARKSLALIALVAALALAACGGDDDETTSAAGDTAATETTTEEQTTGGSGGGETVSISETDFAIDPSDPTVAAGEVTFDISNDGETVHNLEISGQGLAQVSDDLEPGETGQLSVELQPGTYEMFCAIGNHRDLGMDGTVEVQ